MSLENKEALNKPSHIFKFLLIGDNQVGKTCLMRSFVKRDFDEHYDRTVGAEYGVRTLTIDHKTITAQIWDLEGSNIDENFDVYSKDISAIIIVYDLTNNDSFKQLKKYFDLIPKKDPPNIILVGNKSDLISKRKVGGRHVETFKEQCFRTIDLAIEASAKTGHNVEQVFQQAVILSLRQKNSPRNLLIQKIDEYVTRVSKHINKKGEIDFSYGFWFYKSSRMVNREANYLLALSLLEKLSTTDNSIEVIFSEVIGQRDIIIENKKLSNRVDYVNRGINSKELNGILKIADDYIEVNKATRPLLL